MTDRRPPDTAAVEEWREELAGRSTRERVYEVALQLSGPTRVAAVAERAAVSAETAREYLAWFAESGMLTRDSESPATYSRNESYFDWRRVQRLRNRPVAELREELSGLQEQVRSYRERYDADSPAAVDALAHADHADVEAVWDDLRACRTARRRIEDLERVRRERDETETDAPV